VGEEVGHGLGRRADAALWRHDLAGEGVAPAEGRTEEEIKYTFY
jgi:hypothetical protein